MSPDLTAEQWAKLLSLLSLDSALSFYGDMGVPVANPLMFQAMLRDVILAVRRRYEANPDVVPSVADRLFARLGVDAGLFAHWARAVFLGYHAEQPAWSAWEIIFSQWAGSRRESLDFLSQAARDAFIVNYRRDVNSDDVRQKGEDMMTHALSDWDLEMFARRGYGLAWESTPYATVEWITRIERLKRFASRLWLTLADEEREELQRHGQALIDELQVWMPGALPSLDVLLRE